MSNLTLELIAVIAQLCAVSAVEGVNGSWSRLQAVDNYQRSCQAGYLTCIKNSAGAEPVADKLALCVISRPVATYEAKRLLSKRRN